MFSFNDVSLTWKESTGVNGWSRGLIRNAEHTMRENAANGFNLFMAGRIIQPGILPKAELPDGRNRIGETAVKYGLSLASNTPLFKKNEIDIEKFRPALKKRLDYFYYPEYIKFMKRYDKQFKAVFSADETTGQNIPCMLEAHETLARRLPIDLPIYPYLNIHTRVYIPYVPVFFGDWYPISRRDHGGRDPWSTARVVAETVAKAKNVPVHVMLQCFGYFKKSYGLPTPEELRLMANLAFACGAKGIDFHEVNNRGLPWRYNYGYHYTARGNAGELTPIWFTLGECARELTAIGPQAVCASVCPVPAWLKIASPVYKSANGRYNGPQIKFYTLKQAPEKGGSCIAAAINHSEKNTASADMTFPKEAGRVYSLTKMRPVSGRYKISLQPGGAEYFVMGSAENTERISNEVALERAKRAKIIFEIAAERAVINGVELGDSLRSAREAAACIARKDGHNALAKIKAADMEMKKIIRNSDFGKTDRLWNKVRMALSDVSFLFLTHFDLVIPPHLRAKTPLYAKWNNTDDPKMQKHVDNVADCWAEYWQHEQDILEGALGDPVKRSKIEKFSAKALSVSKAAEKYLKTNAHKIAVDDPYAE